MSGPQLRWWAGEEYLNEYDKLAVLLNLLFGARDCAFHTLYIEARAQPQLHVPSYTGPMSPITQVLDTCWTCTGQVRDRCLAGTWRVLDRCWAEAAQL